MHLAKSGKPTAMYIIDGGKRNFKLKLDSKYGAEFLFPTGGLVTWFCDILIHLANFFYESEKTNFIIDFLLCRCLVERATPASSKLIPLFFRDNPLVFKVAFVSYKDNRHLRAVLCPEDLLIEGSDVVEASLISDIVNKEEAFSITHPLVLHGRELVLSCSIKDIEESHFCIDHDLFTIAVLDSGVVLIKEVVRHETDREGGLTDSTTPKDRLKTPLELRTSRIVV